MINKILNKSDRGAAAILIIIVILAGVLAISLTSFSGSKMRTDLMGTFRTSIQADFDMDALLNLAVKDIIQGSKARIWAKPTNIFLGISTNAITPQDVTAFKLSHYDSTAFNSFTFSKTIPIDSESTGTYWAACTQNCSKIDGVKQWSLRYKIVRRDVVRSQMATMAVRKGKGIWGDDPVPRRFAPMTGSPFGPGGEWAPGFDVGDFNGDGVADVVVNGGGIRLGNGDGTFTFHATVQPPLGLPLNKGDGIQHVQAADLNGDGITDLVDHGYLDDTLRVRFGNATAGVANGTFAPSVPYASGSGRKDINHLELADMNGDGCPDVVATEHSRFPLAGNDRITIRLNGIAGGICTGVFGPQTIRDVGDANASMTQVGNFDNSDGLNLPDILLISSTLPGTKLITQTTTGYGPTNNAVFDGGYFIAAGDFDEDGHLDFTSQWSELSFGKGNGAGGFAWGGIATVTTDPWDTTNGYRTKPVVVDLDNDGNLDIISASNQEGTVTVQYGDGTGNFLTPVELAAAPGVAELKVTDVNNDGFLDIVARTQTDGSTYPGPDQIMTFASDVETFSAKIFKVVDDE